MKRSNKLILSIVGIIFAIVAIIAAIYAMMYYNDNVRSNFNEQFDVYIYPGTDLHKTCDSLVSLNLIERKSSLKRAMKKLNAYQSAKSGHYVVNPELTSAAFARMLVYGWQKPIKLSLNGAIRSKGVLARKISAQMMVDSASIAEKLHDNAFLQSYDFDTVSVFSMFIPDTYEMYWNSSVKGIFDRFKKLYNQYWTKERLDAAAAQKLTPKQVAVLASIVDGETRYVPEMPDIAGVYLNRLRKGMKLQADPTVAYCFGYTLNRILKVHLRFDSPYNTYKYKGLPPGPISVPPKSCLEAVLHPSNHGYMFFCASPDFNGSHLFAKKFSTHLKNARRFQRALTKRQKEKQESKD